MKNTRSAKKKRVVRRVRAKAKAPRPIEVLVKRLNEIAYLSSAGVLLGWDQDVHMPEKGADARSVTAAHLASVVHTKLLALDEGGLLARLKRQADRGELRGKGATIVQETWRTWQRQKKLPSAFVAQRAQTESRAHRVWLEARRTSDFKLFLPHLRQIVELKREEARLVGYKDSPYDALLYTYEPGFTTAAATVILNELKDFLIPFLKELKSSKVKVDPKRTLGHFPLSEQRVFNEMIAKKMGFDFAAGRLDEAVHPSTITLHHSDVRITTRYREGDLLYSLGSTIHETGHALYEQSLPSEHFGTPLGEAVSFGVHESQSRLWENNIGKSDAFWRYFYPRLQRVFPRPFKSISRHDLIRTINQVKPSLIRTEADEVTYNLHIILRFEIEREMVEGTIALEDIPAIWRAKMREYLGIEVGSDREGALQDVHWSAGCIGYFPTYALGNIYAAQLSRAMHRAIPDLDLRIAKGDLATPREWLRKHVHIHGKTYEAASLIKRATGEYPTSRAFTDYLSEKYRALYL